MTMTYRLQRPRIKWDICKNLGRTRIRKDYIPITAWSFTGSRAGFTSLSFCALHFLPRRLLPFSSSVEYTAFRRPLTYFDAETPAALRPSNATPDVNLNQKQLQELKTAKSQMSIGNKNVAPIPYDPLKVLIKSQFKSSSLNKEARAFPINVHEAS